MLAFTFVAAESTKAAITEPWTASVIVVPAGQTPTAVDPSADAKDRPLMELQSFPDATATLNRVLCIAGGIRIHALAPRRRSLETLYRNAAHVAEPAALA